MNDYFKQLQKDNKPMSITLDQISDYKESVIREMELMGERSEDISGRPGKTWSVVYFRL